MSCRLAGVVLSLGLLFLFASTLSAQKSADSSSIVVHLTDSSGADIPNATVQIQPARIAPGKNVTTDWSGKLSVDLSPGGYDLTFRSLGFHTETRHIEVQEGTRQILDIVLRVQECSPCVEVQAPDYHH